PQARLRSTSSGSIESSHTFVPVAINDCSGVMAVRSPTGTRKTFPCLHSMRIPVNFWLADGTRLALSTYEVRKRGRCTDCRCGVATGASHEHQELERFRQRFGALRPLQTRG